MADSTFTSLLSIGTVDTASDIIPIIDVSANSSNKITVGTLLAMVPPYSPPLINKGDLFTHNGSNTTRLAVGSANTFLTPDSSSATGLAWVERLSILNTPTRQSWFEDFISSSTIFTFLGPATGGTGANIQSSSSSFTNALGVIRINTGSTATGRGSLATNIVTFPLGSANLDATTKVSANANGGTDTYELRVGFFNTTTSSPTLGAFWKYDVAVSPNWLFCIVVGGVENVTDSGVSFVAFQWYTLRTVMTSTGTISGSINGTFVATPSGTLTTGAALLGVSTTVLKRTGIVATIVDLDYVYLLIDWQVAR